MPTTRKTPRAKQVTLPGLKKLRPPTYLEPFKQAFLARLPGSVFPGGEMAFYYLRLVDIGHTGVEILRRWQRCCRHEDSRYLTPGHFARRFNHWTKEPAEASIEQAIADAGVRFDKEE